MNGILISNRFPKDGVIKKGLAMGVWLEIDRLNPKGNIRVKIQYCVAIFVIM